MFRSTCSNAIMDCCSCRRQQSQPNSCPKQHDKPAVSGAESVTTSAIISVFPANLSFVAGAQAAITISNSSSSSQPANNISASIPVGSGIVAQSNSCGATLAAGASCKIIFAAAAAEGPTSITISGSNTNASQVSVTVTPVAVAHLSVNPTLLMFGQNMTGTVTVVNDSTSTVAAINIDADTSTTSAIAVSANNCPSSLAVGANCTIELTGTQVEGPTSVAISGTNTNIIALQVTVTAAPTALLSVNPSELTMTVGGTATVNVTNSSASTVAANGIASAFPVGSVIIESANSCTPSLAIGDTCTITYTSPIVEGPTDIAVAGSNTTSENVTINFVTAPTASITVSPSSLAFAAGGNAVLTVRNDSASVVDAMAIVAGIPEGSPISVLTNGCTANLAPAAECQITFTSPVSTAATSITISGSNTNTATTSINVMAACIPMTISSTPGVFVSSVNGTVNNLAALTDDNLTNFATVSFLLLHQSATITLTFPALIMLKVVLE